MLIIFTIVPPPVLDTNRKKKNAHNISDEPNTRHNTWHLFFFPLMNVQQS